MAVNSSPTTLATEGDEVQLHKGLKSLALEDGVRTATADPEALSTNLTPWLHFDNRIDSVLVLLARQAPNLSILVSERGGKTPFPLRLTLLPSLSSAAGQRSRIHSHPAPHR